MAACIGRSIALNNNNNNLLRIIFHPFGRHIRVHVLLANAKQGAEKASNVYLFPKHSKNVLRSANVF